jgi:LysM repeat protein
MQHILILLAFWLGCLAVAGATGDDKKFIVHTDTIEGLFKEQKTLCTYHHLAQGQTIYSLLKFYNISHSDLKELNPSLSESPKVGTRLTIPFRKKAFLSHMTPDFVRWKYAPVVHTVQAGETVYRLTVMYGIPADTLLKRNKIANHVLILGQKVHVGWYSTAGVPAEAAAATRHYASDPHLDRLRRSNAELRAKFLDQAAVSKPMKETGPAYWMRSSNIDLFVLHDKARVGSSVELYNPQSRRTVYAKVLGRIPAGSQDPLIKIVLSEPVGKYLGSVDKKVFLRIKYTP